MYDILKDIHDLTESKFNQYNSDEILRALRPDSIDAESEDEVGFLEHLRSRINQTYPEIITWADIVEILKEPSFIDYSDVEQIGLVTYALQAGGFGEILDDELEEGVWKDYWFGTDEEEDAEKDSETAYQAYKSRKSPVNVKPASVRDFTPTQDIKECIRLMQDHIDHVSGGVMNEETLMMAAEDVALDFMEQLQATRLDQAVSVLIETWNQEEWKHDLSHDSWKKDVEKVKSGDLDPDDAVKKWGKRGSYFLQFSEDEPDEAGEIMRLEPIK